MINFKDYLRNLTENQTVNNPNLEKAKQSFMNAFQQEFSRDPQSALIWLNNLYTQSLPTDYKKFYGQWQQGQKVQQPQQTNQAQQAGQMNQGA